jgi:hypothetical protein
MKEEGQYERRRKYKAMSIKRKAAERKRRKRIEEEHHHHLHRRQYDNGGGVTTKIISLSSNEGEKAPLNIIAATNHRRSGISVSGVKISINEKKSGEEESSEERERRHSIGRAEKKSRIR